ARAIRPPRQRRRAEGTVLVTAILDLEPAAGARGEAPQYGVHARRLESGGREHSDRVGAAHHRADSRESGDRAVVARRSASHDDGASRGVLAPQAAYQAAQLRLALVRDGARV